MRTTQVLQRISSCPFGGWLKRLGWAGFLFFLIKGLLWLSLPPLLVYFGFSH